MSYSLLHLQSQTSNYHNCHRIYTSRYTFSQLSLPHSIQLYTCPPLNMHSSSTQQLIHFQYKASHPFKILSSSTDISSASRTMSTPSTTPSTTSNTSNNSYSSSRRYSRVGIGGAGNFYLTKSLSPSPSRPVVARITGAFRVGIGGAGNTRSFEDRAIAISEQEDREKKILRRKSASLNRHYGIGGAGNALRRPSVDSDSGLDSTTSKTSGEDRMRAKVVAVFA